MSIQIASCQAIGRALWWGKLCLSWLYSNLIYCYKMFRGERSSFLIEKERMEFKRKIIYLPCVAQQRTREKFSFTNTRPSSAQYLRQFLLPLVVSSNKGKSHFPQRNKDNRKTIICHWFSRLINIFFDVLNIF